MKITLKDRLQDIAVKYGIGFKDLGDKVRFYIHFCPDFEWHEASLLLWWKQNPGGGLNWWEDWVFDGKHRISGPGYPAYAIHAQEPFSESELLAKIDTAVAKDLYYYKQFNHHI